MTHTNQSRAEFEKHVLAPNGFDENGAGWVIRNADGTYRHENIQARWMTWQAARATTEQSSGVELPEPVAWLIERHAFSVSPHGQDAEGNSWLEEAHEPGEQGSFAVYTEQQVSALLAGVKDSLTAAPAIRAIRVELTDEQRRGLQADCSGPIPGAAHRGGRAAPDQQQTRMDAQSGVVGLVLPEIIEKALDWIENDTRECVRDLNTRSSDPNEIYASLDQLERILCAAPAVPQGWMPIESAPKDDSVLLYAPPAPIYAGRKRLGLLGEPQQDLYVWRCDSSGRFASPTHWMPLPQPPKEQTLQWCNSCGEGVTTFCRGKTDNCPRGLTLPGGARNMNDKQMMQTARDAGIDLKPLDDDYCDSVGLDRGTICRVNDIGIDEVKRLIDLAKAEEREACIKTCYGVQSMLVSLGAGEDAENGAGDCIDAIRARKDSA